MVGALFRSLLGRTFGATAHKKIFLLILYGSQVSKETPRGFGSKGKSLAMTRAHPRQPT